MDFAKKMKYHTPRAHGIGGDITPKLQESKLCLFRLLALVADILFEYFERQAQYAILNVLSESQETDNLCSNNAAENNTPKRRNSGTQLLLQSRCGVARNDRRDQDRCQNRHRVEKISRVETIHPQGHVHGVWRYPDDAPINHIRLQPEPPRDVSYVSPLVEFDSAWGSHLSCEWNTLCQEHRVTSWNFFKNKV